MQGILLANLASDLILGEAKGFYPTPQYADEDGRKFYGPRPEQCDDWARLDNTQQAGRPVLHLVRCGAAHVSSSRPSRRRRRRRRRRPRHRRHRRHRRCRPFSGVGVGRGDRAGPSRHCEVGNALAQVQQE